MWRPNERYFKPLLSRQYVLLFQAVDELQYAWLRWYKLHNWGKGGMYIPAMIFYAPKKRLAVFLYRRENSRGYPSKLYNALTEYGIPYLIIPRRKSKDEMKIIIKNTIERLKHENNKRN